MYLRTRPACGSRSGGVKFPHWTVPILSTFVQQYVIPLAVACASGVIIPRIAGRNRKPLASVAWFLSITAVVFVLLYIVMAHTVGGLTVAGTVVDDATGRPIAGAEISVVGRTESARSATNGNFSMSIKVDPDQPESVRLQVNKPGYQTLDQPVTPPRTDIMLGLKSVTP